MHHTGTEIAEQVRSRHEQDLVDWAEDLFGDVSVPFHAEMNTGDTGMETSLFVTWEAMAIELSTTYKGDHWAFICRQCDSCQAYTAYVRQAITSRTKLLSLLNDDAVATARTNEAACFACRWLAEAQTEARVATTRFARWRFKLRRGKTVEDVLSRTR